MKKLTACRVECGFHHDTDVTPEGDQSVSELDTEQLQPTNSEYKWLL